MAVWCLDLGVRSVSPIAERPALRLALVALREQEARVLVVAKHDRIARDVVLAASIQRAVTSAGARLVSGSGEGNRDSSADAFIRTVIDGAAQYEHGLIRARTCAALAAKRAHGERVGSVPFGFAVDAGGVRLVINEQEQATIERVRELRACFSRAHCDACGHDLLVAFSCHGRSICPSFVLGAAHRVAEVPNSAKNLVSCGLHGTLPTLPTAFPARLIPVRPSAPWWHPGTTARPTNPQAFHRVHRAPPRG